MGDLAGCVAFVTGGTSGIGRAACLAFARHGVRVAVAGRQRDQGAQTVEAVRALGGDAIFVPVDVTDARDVANAVQAAVKTFGRLDIAFNNAGVEADGVPLADGTPELYDRIMDTNVKGVWLCMREEIAAMRAAGGGAIVNTASVGGVVGFPGASIYSASKHAVVGLTKAAALEVAKEGIRVNCVAPGTVDTPMFGRFAAEAALREQVAAMHPLGRIVAPEEIAEAALWLCSPRSSFVTGHTLLVDGGFSAG